MNLFNTVKTINDWNLIKKHITQLLFCVCVKFVRFSCLLCFSYVCSSLSILSSSFLFIFMLAQWRFFASPRFIVVLLRGSVIATCCYYQVFLYSSILDLFHNFTLKLSQSIWYYGRNWYIYPYLDCNLFLINYVSTLVK